VAKFSLEKQLAYRAEDLCQLVGDVEHYPDFIPWIVRLRAYNHQTIGDEVAQFDADVSVGVKRFSETFSTRVTHNAHDLSLDMRLIRGPFRKLEGHWQFASIESGAQVRLNMDVDIRNPILNAFFQANLDQACNRLMSLFEARAKALLKTV